MLIKKHQLKQPQQANAHSSSEEASHAASTQGVHQPSPALPPEPEPVAYSPELVSSGELPERRENTTNLQDRRQGYRRIEDRHLISKAHEEARYIKDQAYEEGLELGLMRVKDELNELREKLDEALLSRTAALATLSDDIAPIAVEIAERLIKVELSCDEDLVNTIVEDTLQKLDRNSKTVLIKVNPSDKSRVRNYLAEHPPTHLKAEIMVIDQHDVEAGGCVVETDSGLIDASFHTRLTILKELFGAYNPPEPPALPEESDEDDMTLVANEATDHELATSDEADELNQPEELPETVDANHDLTDDWGDEYGDS